MNQYNIYILADGQHHHLTVLEAESKEKAEQLAYELYPSGNTYVAKRADGVVEE